MALYPRDSSFFRQSVCRGLGKDTMDGSRDPDRRVSVHRRMDAVGLENLAGCSYHEVCKLGRTAGCSLPAD